MLKLPPETGSLAWAAAGGAAAIAIVGFAWGGWTTGGKAESAAHDRASTAVIAALAPICVRNFEAQADSPANLVALKKVDSWAQGDFVEKGGWATLPGPPPPGGIGAVARACAQILTKA